MSKGKFWVMEQEETECHSFCLHLFSDNVAFFAVYPLNTIPVDTNVLFGEIRVNNGQG